LRRNNINKKGGRYVGEGKHDLGRRFRERKGTLRDRIENYARPKKSGWKSHGPKGGGQGGGFEIVL